MPGLYEASERALCFGRGSFRSRGVSCALPPGEDGVLRFTKWSYTLCRKLEQWPPPPGEVGLTHGVKIFWRLRSAGGGAYGVRFYCDGNFMAVESR